MIDLSIIIPTCNRAEQLRRGLEALLIGVNCSYEIIVVDGGSTDATPAVLDEAKHFFRDRLRIHRQEKRLGFAAAANLGLRAARGIFATWLGDDARPHPAALDSAVEQLARCPDRVGLLAMFHRSNATRSVAYEIDRHYQTYRLLHIRGTLYANYALGLRQTFARLGYFDERFHSATAMPDFSLKSWHAGLTIVPAPASLIDHETLPHDRVHTAALFAKWLLPGPRSQHEKFDPKIPCTLRGQRPEPRPNHPEAA